MWNSKRDLEIWETIAQEAHSRHSNAGGYYVRSLSAVENIGHKLIAAKAANARRILEVGIGGGEHLVFRNPSAGNEHYIGVDLSFEYAKICKEAFGIPVIRADASMLPFGPAQFDCVVAIAILEHVQSLERTLTELERVLEPGGRLLVIIPTNGSLAVNLFKMVMTYPALRRRGIARPDLVWHHLNVNCFKRVQGELIQRFDIVEQVAVPVSLLPWWLSPLWVLDCKRR